MNRREMIESLEKENPEMEIRIFGEDGEMLYDTTVRDQLEEAEGLDDEAFGEASYQPAEYVLYAVERENRSGGSVLISGALQSHEDALDFARRAIGKQTGRERSEFALNINSYRTSVPYEEFDFSESAWDWISSEEIK